MKDNKKVTKNHIKIQKTQPSFKTHACNEGCTAHLYSKMY